MIPITAKGIISAGNGVNLYRGCTHGCIYCDSRSACYHVKHFDTPGYKENALTLIRKELSRRRKKAMITTGAMTDPYLHMEEELRLTRGMLELLYEFGFGVGILTKSDMALRDIELISRINERYPSAVCYTITTVDDDLCRKLEPHVSPTSRRLECLAQFADRGIVTGVWMIPILPFICDSEENIREIVRRCAHVGVRYIMSFGIGTTMREGSRDYFYRQLDRLFPGMKARYMDCFGNSYVCNSPEHVSLWQIFEDECRAHNIIIDHDQIQALCRPAEAEQLSLF